MRRKLLGVTLIEMLMVAAVLAGLLYLGTQYMYQSATNAKVKQTSMQMQQILNAAVAYYLANSDWPPTLACLQGGGGSGCVGTIQYVPPTLGNSAFNVPLVVGPASQSSGSTLRPIFAVSVNLPNAYAATSVAARLPLSQVAGTMVVAYINVPGANLNKSPSVHFAGIYHHGGLVPVPQCPVKGQVPQIIVVPASVSGVNDAGQGLQTLYPISSFTAYARGPNSGASCPSCDGAWEVQNCPTATQSYWAACLDLVTQKGRLAGTGQSTPTSDYRWGQYVTLMVFTRCEITNETKSSSYTSVYSN